MAEMMGWLGSAGHVAGGVLEGLAHGSSSMWGEAAHMVPGLGALAGGTEAMLGLNRANLGAGVAGNLSDTPEQRAQGLREEERGFGDAIWGGLSAGASFFPPAAIAAGVMGMASEAAYGQSPGAVVANWINGVDGGQHLSVNPNGDMYNHEENEGLFAHMAE